MQAADSAERQLHFVGIIDRKASEANSALTTHIVNEAYRTAQETITSFPELVKDIEIDDTTRRMNFDDNEPANVVANLFGKLKNLKSSLPSDNQGLADEAVSISKRLTKALEGYVDNDKRPDLVKKYQTDAQVLIEQLKLPSASANAQKEIIDRAVTRPKGVRMTDLIKAREAFEKLEPLVKSANEATDKAVSSSNPITQLVNSVQQQLDQDPRLKIIPSKGATEGSPSKLLYDLKQAEATLAEAIRTGAVTVAEASNHDSYKQASIIVDQITAKVLPLIRRLIIKPLYDKSVNTWLGLSQIAGLGLRRNEIETQSNDTSMSGRFAAALNKIDLVTQTGAEEFQGASAHADSVSALIAMEGKVIKVIGEKFAPMLASIKEQVSNAISDGKLIEPKPHGDPQTNLAIIENALFRMQELVGFVQNKGYEGTRIPTPQHYINLVKDAAEGHKTLLGLIEAKLW